MLLNIINMNQNDQENLTPRQRKLSSSKKVKNIKNSEDKGDPKMPNKQETEQPIQSNDTNVEPGPVDSSEKICPPETFKNDSIINTPITPNKVQEDMKAIHDFMNNTYE